LQGETVSLYDVDIPGYGLGKSQDQVPIEELKKAQAIAIRHCESEANAFSKTTTNRYASQN
jgi:hypothetical protein